MSGSGLVWLGSCGLVLVLFSLSVSGFSLTVNFCFFIGLGLVWFLGSGLSGFVLVPGLVWFLCLFLFSIFSNISVIFDTELIFLFSPRTGFSSLGLVCVQAGLAGFVQSGLSGFRLVCKYNIIDEGFPAVVFLFTQCFSLISGLVFELICVPKWGGWR